VVEQSQVPAALLRTVLEALDESGCGYALIHPGKTLDEAVSSDVDIAFDRNPNEILPPILRRLSEAFEARLVHCLHYDVPHGYYYVIRVDGVQRGFLHLDCLYDPLGVNRYRLPTPFLMEDAVAGPLGRQTQKEKMAVYLLMKRAIKRDVSTEQLEVLRGCLGDTSETLLLHLRVWFGNRAPQLVAQLLACNGIDESRAILARLRASASRNFLRRHAPRYLLSLLLTAKRKAGRLVRPTGFFVVLIGPDGSGKSTVAGLVLSELKRAFRETWRFHWRPNLLPKLGRRATEGRGPETSQQQPPPEISKYRGIVSLMRFVYYWVDFVLGYWLILYRRKAQTTLIVGERYFPDVLVLPERYGFTAPKSVMRLAAKWVPSPDLLILLKDDPEIIYARKPELPAAKIARQIEAYEEEAKYWGGATVVITEGGPAAVAARVADLILDKCSRRPQTRLGQSERAPRWRAFPAAKNVKVWCSDADTLSTALNLYHPYSRSGRFVKSVAGSLPRAAQRCLFRDRPDIQVAKRLCLFTRVIRQTLNDDRLEISFSTGTPGRHRKLTAQASRGRALVSYVKITEDKSISALLQQEAEMLTWLHGKKFCDAIVPRVMAFDHHHEHTFLFLTSPAKPGRQRRLTADDTDVQFLSVLASLQADKASVAQILEQMGWETYLEHLERRDLNASELLRGAVQPIYSLLGRDGVRVTPSHGDYAPWHTLEVEDGRLYVFDWEYGTQRAPALSDLFHRVLMPARLILRQQPNRVIDRLLELANDPVLSPVITRAAVSREQLPAYLLMYLLGQLVRGGDDTADKFLMESIRYSLTLTGHVTQRRKVLVSAYACEPGHGSEPGVGWHMCQAIGREHEAWIITRKNNRQQIEAALIEQANPHLHFWYADLPGWMRVWKRGGRGIRLYYYLWQFAALYESIRLMRSVKFDLAHHITFVNDFVFTFLAFLPIPFVWGPIGSVSKRPASLSDGKISLLRERAEFYFKAFLRSVDPLFWLSAIRAKLVIGINGEIGRRFPLSLLVRNKFISYPAIGVEQEIAAAHLSAMQPQDGLLILSIGRLVPLKAFHLTVQAFATLCRHEPTATLTIVGDGRLQQSLERLATHLDVREKVNFVRWLPRSEALNLMREADVFLFPSFEAAGMVVLEAMAHGLPIVCLQRSGPADLITKECGFAVPVGPMENTVEKLANALEALARDTALRVRMGAAARRVIQDKYLWEDRHRMIMHWYLAADIGMTVLPERRCGA
jgi:glycosyltransferase involved in cell wall biosynthesis/thymidylate kinase